MIDFTKLLTTLKRWCVEIVVLIAIVILACLWINSHREAKAFQARATDLEKDLKMALQESAKGQEANERADQLQKTLNVMDGDRKALLTKVDVLNDELKKRPMPPNPSPAPSEQGQVIADLKAMGTSPEVLPPFKLAFPASDGPTLWSWGRQFARVPSLEARLDTLDRLKTTLQTTLGTTTDQLYMTETQRDGFRDSSNHFQAAYKAETVQTGLLKVEVGTLTSQRDRARRTRIYFGVGGVALGSYLTYRATRR